MAGKGKILNYIKRLIETIVDSKRVGKTKKEQGQQTKNSYRT